MKIKKTRTIVHGCLLLLVMLLSNGALLGSAQSIENPLQLDVIKVYLPLIRNVPLPTRDLTISAMEVTQAIQTLDNQVSLVSGRPTAVRVYARVNEAVALANVKVSLSATRSGVALAGSPLVSAPGSAQPTSIAANTLRADISKSFNFTLPAGWLSGQVTLTARVDSGETYWENSEANNTSTFAGSFVAVPALTVKVVPIRYTDIYNGVIFDPPSPTFLHAALMSIYPVGSVNIVVRSTPLSFVGDLYYVSEWERLLDKVTDLKASDGSPYAEVYYGLVPLIKDGFTWFEGGVAGIGWIGLPAYNGQRVSVGLTSALGLDGGPIAAHEIGHNLGRLHSPCGNPGDIQPGYPYPDGSIGQYGLDVSAWSVKSPAVYKDIMGYCSPEWVSDFTYKGFMSSQINYGDALPPTTLTQPGITLNASMDDTGSIQLQPSYVLNAAPTGVSNESDYQAQFVDENGAILSSHPLSILLASAANYSIKKIHALLPLPAQNALKLRILYKDQVLAEQSLAQTSTLPGTDAASRQLSLAQVGEELTLSWNNPETPAMVRYSTDNGATWTVLEIGATGGALNIPLADLPQLPLILEVTPAWSLETYRLDYIPSAP